MMSLRPSEPIMRTDSDGYITPEWPDPLATSYQVSTELLKQWVDWYNELVDWRRGVRQFEKVGLADWMGA